MEQNQIVICKEDFLEQNDEYVMTAFELGKRLGYKNPFRAIKKLYKRYERWLQPFKRDTPNWDTPGGKQTVLSFSEIGVYFIALKSNTPISNDFAVAVGKFLSEIRNNQKYVITKEQVDVLKNDIARLHSKLLDAQKELYIRRHRGLNFTNAKIIDNLAKRNIDPYEIADIVGIKVGTVSGYLWNSLPAKMAKTKINDKLYDRGGIWQCELMGESGYKPLSGR